MAAHESPRTTRLYDRTKDEITIGEVEWRHVRDFLWTSNEPCKSITSGSAMSIKEILEELPKLTEEEKRQLWNVLDHELAPEEDEESPEVLAAIDEGIRSLEGGEKTYTI